MTLRPLFSVLALFLAVCTAARDSTSVRKCRLVSLQLSGTFLEKKDKRKGLPQIMNLAPNMPLIQQDKSGYVQYTNPDNKPTHVEGMFRVEIAKKDAPEGRKIVSSFLLGLGFGQVTTYNKSYIKSDINNFSTFTAANGDVIYLHLVETRRYDFLYRISSLYISAGQAFRLAGRKKSNLYAGYLLEPMVPIDSRVMGTFSYTAIKTAGLIPNPSPSQVPESYDKPTELFLFDVAKTSLPLAGRICFPVGMMVGGQPGKKLFKIGFNYEIRPGFETFHVPGIINSNRFILEIGFGFKYCFANPADAKAKS